jgi:LacI family transcriptional regulator
MDKKVRLKDIAKLANVSVGTVDRVIHKRGEVSQESYNRIMAIVEKTGYTPNLIARTLGSNKSFRIVAVTPEPSQDEYWKFAQDGIVQAQDDWSQYSLQIKTCHFDLYNRDSFLKAIKAAIRQKPDGLLLAPIFHQEAVKGLALSHQEGIPFVLFNNNIPSADPLSFVGQNLYQSGQLGAELLQLGQQPGTYAILHVYDDIANSTHLSEKEKGFKDYFDHLKHTTNVALSLDLNFSHKKTLEKEIKDLLSIKDLRGLLVTTSKGASLVSRLLDKHGKNGIRLVAYDLLKENIAQLNKGIIDFLINQNSRQQASVGLSHLANFLLFKKHPAAFLFPLEIITRKNLSSYLPDTAAAAIQKKQVSV